MEKEQSVIDLIEVFAKYKRALELGRVRFNFVQNPTYVRVILNFPILWNTRKIYLRL
jgi:hypothetical protein